MIIEMQTSKIAANPWQVRREVNEAHIAELAADIKANGLLQTPMGRLVKQDGTPYNLQEMSDIRREEYHRHGVQIAFGHNRLAAYLHNAILWGSVWGRMPVDIRVLTDEQMAAYAWSENEKRAEVSPIDKAEAIRKRMDDFQWTQDEAGKRMGMAQSTVGHLLRLLTLPEEVKASVRTGEISQRQAKVLVSVPEEIQGEVVQAAKNGVPAEELRQEIVRHSEQAIMPAGIIPAPEAIAKIGTEELKRQSNEVYARAALILADKLEIEDVRAWRMLLRHIDLDFRNNTRNWDLRSLRMKIALKMVISPSSHREQPAEDYMYVRDMFRAVGLDLPSFDEMVTNIESVH